MYEKTYLMYEHHTSVLSQFDMTLDLKINLGHCDLYFMVQWVCLISWRLFDVWTPYFGITSLYDPLVDLKINIGNCELYFMVQWFCLVHVSWKLFSGCQNIILWDYESAWPDIWPQNICRSVTYISWSTEFALYLEDCLMYEHYTLW